MKGPNNKKKLIHKAPLYCPAHLLPIPIKYSMKNLIDFLLDWWSYTEIVIKIDTLQEIVLTHNNCNVVKNKNVVEKACSF